MPTLLSTTHNRAHPNTILSVFSLLSHIFAELMAMIEHIQVAHAKAGRADQAPVAWTPDGRVVVIRNKEELTTHWIPLYFQRGKFSSFTRKLYRWGFRQVSVADVKRNVPKDQRPLCYFNECFRRDDKHLLKEMRCQKGGQQLRAQAPTTDRRSYGGEDPAISSGADQQQQQQQQQLLLPSMEEFGASLQGPTRSLAVAGHHQESLLLALLHQQQQQQASSGQQNSLAALRFASSMPPMASTHHALARLLHQQQQEQQLQQQQQANQQQLLARTLLLQTSSPTHQHSPNSNPLNAGLQSMLGRMSSQLDADRALVLELLSQQARRGDSNSSS